MVNKSKKAARRRRKSRTMTIAFLLTAMLFAACVALPVGENISSSGAGGAPPSESDTAQPDVSSSEAPPEPDPEPLITTLRVSATGDNLIHDGLYLQAKKRAGGEGYDFAALYENIAPFYKDFDINWINQETLITDELPPSSYPCFCTPAAMGQTLYDIGWRVIAMSNNHAYDKGADGIAATRRFWASMPEDIVTTGLFAGEADYENIPIQEKDGVRIAYLAYTEHTNGLPTPSAAEANVIYTSETDVMERQIRLAREQADIVVVGVHWGVEGSHTVTDAQRALGQSFADWGADIIIGTHPHVIQPIETLTAAETGKVVPIAYSLGNFVSTQASADNLIGLILTYDITKITQPDGTSHAEVGNVHAVPMVMHYDTNYTNARAYLYRDYTEELAHTHGVRARYGGFSRDYIIQTLKEYIDEAYLVLE